jgi:hypothetical protein
VDERSVRGKRKRARHVVPLRADRNLERRAGLKPGTYTRREKLDERESGVRS